MTPTAQTSSTLDGLPKQFVNALRTLFDVLDDKGTGFVKFSDIELRWQDDGSKGLPKGVIESLRKVTPPNGLLSFERFCAGLKICLLRNQMEGRGMRREEPMKQRPPSAPLLDMDSNQVGENAWEEQPRHQGMSQQRTLSMPQLPAQQPTAAPPPIKSHLYGPPKPPRVGLAHSQSQTQMVQPVDKAEIRSALHNWQMGVMIEEERRFPRPRPLGDVAPSNNNIAEQQQGSSNQTNQYKKVNGRRREPRRHTLHNGIDYNMQLDCSETRRVKVSSRSLAARLKVDSLSSRRLFEPRYHLVAEEGVRQNQSNNLTMEQVSTLKRMKQIEVEKDILMQGLEAVDRAREWYLKQIAVVQDKMQYIGKMGYSEQWSDAQEERVGLQRARIFEVNRHLASLTESGERGGLPLHMNLAVNPYPSNNVVGQLKHQNHFLQQEVNKKNERITALEREKASLIRELFHARAQNRSQPQDNNTSYL